MIDYEARAMALRTTISLCDLIAFITRPGDLPLADGEPDALSALSAIESAFHELRRDAEELAPGRHDGPRDGRDDAARTAVAHPRGRNPLPNGMTLADDHTKCPDLARCDCVCLECLAQWEGEGRPGPTKFPAAPVAGKQELPGSMTVVPTAILRNLIAGHPDPSVPDMVIRLALGLSEARDAIAWLLEAASRPVSDPDRQVELERALANAETELRDASHDWSDHAEARR